MGSRRGRAGGNIASLRLIHYSWRTVIPINGSSIIKGSGKCSQCHSSFLSASLMEVKAFPSAFILGPGQPATANLPSSLSLRALHVCTVVQALKETRDGTAEICQSALVTRCVTVKLFHDLQLLKWSKVATGRWRFLVCSFCC